MVLRTITPQTRAAIIIEATAILKGGGVIVLPTDTVYGLAAHPDCPQALARMIAIKQRPDDKPIALLASSTEAIEQLGGHFSPTAKRLAQTFRPGALTLVLTCGDVREGVRVPDQRLARELIAACGGMLRVTSANVSGAAPALTAQEAMRDVGQQVDLVIDDGPVRGGTASTVVEDGADAWKILRKGPIHAGQLRRALADLPASDLTAGAQATQQKSLILFVCSGNTCRSPMAESLMRAHLRSKPDWHVASAGTMALTGMPASIYAQQAVAELKLTLSSHKSRLITPALINAATLIITMGYSHFERIIELCPGARDKVFLLRRFSQQADGTDIVDPMGGSLDDYCECRNAISECLPRLLEFLDELA